MMSRGPNGFCREDMGIALESIPHERVEYFNGAVLVLALSPTDCPSLLTDSRFQWQKPPARGSYLLGGYEFMQDAKYDILVYQKPKGIEPVLEDWRLYAIDKTRRLLFMSSDHWPFFRELISTNKID